MCSLCPWKKSSTQSYTLPHVESGIGRKKPSKPIIPPIKLPTNSSNDIVNETIPEEIEEISNEPTVSVVLEDTTLIQSGTSVAQNENSRKITEENVEPTIRRAGYQGGNVDHNAEIEKHPKTKEDEDLIRKAISNNTFLSNILKDDQLQSVIDSMYSQDVEAKQVIIKQGDEGDYMFVSATGRFEIIIDEEIYDTFNDNRIFGELAILYTTPRLATIKSLTKGRVWKLNRNVYQAIIVKNAIAEQEELLTFLRKVPVINKATDSKLHQISNLLKHEFFKTGTVIIKQGDRGDLFYIIKAGTTTVSVNGQGVVANLTRGQFFGDRALTEEDCRQATVTADSPGVDCLILSRSDFIENLGDIIKFIETVDQKPTENIISSKYDHVQLDDLKVIKTIGVGGFGRVALVRNIKNEEEVFAIKFLKKSVILQQQQKEHALNEKQIQSSCDSIFIVRMYMSYQDKQYLYFLMECCLGGDVFGLLQKQKNRCFEEPGAKFIAACILEAIAYLHERNYVYRDLKPENMLVDNQGYMKLTDFGFAKKLVNNKKTYTFAGTPEYVAPEIIYNRGHGKPVDYWAFGIFIFELLVGKTPFRTSDPTHMKTYSLIIKGVENVVFPSRLPKPAQNIIRKLCKSVPVDRLGCQRNGIADIRNHKWLNDFDWAKLRSHKMKSPFIPKIKSALDTLNFEEFAPDSVAPPECSIWEGF